MTDQESGSLEEPETLERETLDEPQPAQELPATYPYFDIGGALVIPEAVTAVSSDLASPTSTWCGTARSFLYVACASPVPCELEPEDALAEVLAARRMVAGVRQAQAAIRSALEPDPIDQAEDAMRRMARAAREEMERGHGEDWRGEGGEP